MRIHLLEAEELTAKDTVIKGIIDGKSDPYAVLRVGTQTFTSHTVDSNLNPQWREMFEVRVRERDGESEVSERERQMRATETEKEGERCLTEMFEVREGVRERCLR